jgi:hypothetical protein
MWVVFEAIGIIWEHVVTNCIGQEGIDASSDVREGRIGIRFKDYSGWGNVEFQKYVEWIQEIGIGG